MVIAHSRHVSRWGSKLDYLGITTLITGSFFPTIYYGFYCFPHLQKIYWTMVNLPLILLTEDFLSGNYTYLCDG